LASAAAILTWELDDGSTLWPLADRTSELSSATVHRESSTILPVLPVCKFQVDRWLTMANFRSSQEAAV
jgi:hypothetical protein